MPDLLPEIYKKHKIWIEIVESFGCNKDTAEDIVMEMYIRIKNKLDKGLNIDYGEHDYNYYYVFKILKSMFLDLKVPWLHKKLSSQDPILSVQVGGLSGVKLVTSATPQERPLFLASKTYLLTSTLKFQ